MDQNADSLSGTDMAVPVSIATALRKNPAGTALQLGVNLQMPGSVAGPVATMFSLLDETGKSIQAGRRDLPPGNGNEYSFAFALALTTPGKYTLRISAADATGRVGSAEQRVDATLARIGKRMTTVQVAGRVYHIPTSQIATVRDDGIAIAEAAKAYAYRHA